MCPERFPPPHSFPPPHTAASLPCLPSVLENMSLLWEGEKKILRFGIMLHVQSKHIRTSVKTQLQPLCVNTTILCKQTDRLPFRPHYTEAGGPGMFNSIITTRFTGQTCFLTKLPLNEKDSRTDSSTLPHTFSLKEIISGYKSYQRTKILRSTRFGR